MKACSNMSRDSGFKLGKERFRLNFRKEFVAIKVMEDWNRLSRKVVKIPHLETFKIKLMGL